MTHTSWKTLLSSIVFMLFRSQKKIPMMTFKNQCVNCNHHKTSSNLFILWYAHDFQMTLFWFLFKTMRRRRITGKKSRDVFFSYFFVLSHDIFFNSYVFWMTKKMLIFVWMNILVSNILERITNWYVLIKWKNCIKFLRRLKNYMLKNNWESQEVLLNDLKLSTDHMIQFFQMSISEFRQFQPEIREFFFNGKKYAENQICLIYAKTYISPKCHL